MAYRTKHYVMFDRCNRGETAPLDDGTYMAEFWNGEHAERFIERYQPFVSAMRERNILDPQFDWVLNHCTGLDDETNGDHAEYYFGKEAE